MRVTFRAVFMQPTGVLNPMGLKIPTPITVELYPGPSNSYRAREIDSKHRRSFRHVQRMANLEAAKSAIRASFTEQLTDWTMHDPAKNGAALSPDEVITLPGGTVTRKPPTHYATAMEGLSKTTRRAVCGKTVDVTVIVQTRPTCPQCQIIFDKEHTA